MRYKAFEAINLNGDHITVDEWDMIPLVKKIRKEIVDFYQNEDIENDNSDWDITDIVDLDDSYLWKNNILKKYNCSEDSELQSTKQGHSTSLWFQKLILIQAVELDVLKTDEDICRRYFEREKLLRKRGKGKVTLKDMEESLVEDYLLIYPKAASNLLEIEF